MGFSDWFDNNWVDLARLLVQCGIFVAVVWYSRKILKTIRGSQEQLGALLRLSVADMAAHDGRPGIQEPEMAPPGFAVTPLASRRQEETSPAAIPSAFGFGSRAAAAPEREQSLGGRVGTDRIAVEEPETGVPTPSFTPWVAAPMHADAESAENLSSRMTDSAHTLGRWTEEPRPRTVNPIKKLIRWLQAPAGSKAHVGG